MRVNNYNIIVLFKFLNHIIYFMIHKSRKLLNHFFAPISRNWKFNFSQSNQSDEYLRILEGKAYLSDKIINQIINPRVDIQQKSLRQHLIDLIDSTTEVPQPSRDFMKSMFTTGIPIDNHVFDQIRIKKAINFFGTNKKMFTFCPTILVTSQMFEALRHQIGNTLFTGHYGISTSVSVMLYSILSNLIAQYKFKTSKQSSEELGAMIEDSQKVIYFNIRGQNFTIEECKASILRQCRSQIKENEWRNFFNQGRKNNSIVELKKYYQDKGIQLILILDQISSVIGLSRNSNSSQDAEKSQRKTKIKSFKYALQPLDPEFRSIHYLSSATISTQLLRDLKKLGSQDGHQSLNLRQIDYFENLLIKDAAKEMVDLFLFDLQRKFQIKILTENKQIPFQNVPQKYKKFVPADRSQIQINNLIRNYLTQKLIESYGYILTFDQIRKTLQSQERKINKIVKELNKGSDFDSIEKLQGLLSDTILPSHKKIQQAFNSIFKKQQQPNSLTNQIKRNLIFCLYQSASSFKGQPDNQSLYKIDIEPYYPKIRRQNLNQYLGKNLFKFYKDDLKTFIPPKLLMFILQPYVQSTIAYMLENRAHLMKSFFTTSMFRQYTELTFARMISQIQPQIRFIFLQKKQALKFNIENAQLLLLEPIPPQIQQDYEFLSRLKKELKKKIIDLNIQKDLSRQITIKKDYFFITNKHFLCENSSSLENTITKDAIKNNDSKGRAIDCAIMTIQVDNNKKTKVNLAALQNKQIYQSFQQVQRKT